MIGFIVTLVSLAVAVYAVAYVLPGVTVKDAGSAVVVAIVFSILNFLIGWLLFGVLGIATLGLGFVFPMITRWIVTSILLKIADALLTSFSIKDFFPTALIAGGLIALISTLLEQVIGRVL